MAIHRALIASLLTIAMAASPSLSTAQSKTDYISAPSSLSPADETEMRGIIVRLNHALDAANYELYASFFAEDAEFISDFGVARGPAEIAAALEQSRPFITGKRHVASNYLFSGDGETALLTTYLIVFERETAIDYVGSAINIDTFEKRDGEWVLVRHDSELDPSTASAMQAAMSSVTE